MAKKKANVVKVKKEVVPEAKEIKIEPLDNALAITLIETEVEKQKRAIVNMNQRIDRIITALDKSKSVRGL